MAYSPIEDKYLSALTAFQFPDMPVEPAMPEQTMPGRQEGDVMLAMGGSGAGKGRTSRPMTDIPTALLDLGAGGLRGAATQTLGLPGDIQMLYNGIKSVFNRPEDQSRLEAFAKGLEEGTLFQSTEQIGKQNEFRIPGTGLAIPMPPVIPPNAKDAAMRANTAVVGQAFGELAPLPGAVEAGIAGTKALIKATKNLPVGMSIKPVGESSDALLMPVKIGDKELKIPADQAAVLQKALKNLTPAEQAKFRTDTAQKFVTILQDLPSTKEFAAAAVGGKAKKGWYEGSTQAILQVFGADAPRFAALLSATSPQTSVESNLFNALQVWKNWTAAGRPVDRESIVKVMGQSVQGNKGEESVLDAWINNSVAALSSDDPSTVVLSGPKVNSFMLNLQGNVEEVTNDAWMAAFSLVDQKLFAGSITKGGDPGKGPGYLAMNARVRETATYLTKVTGETWTPAEVQETIWSWAKTLYEKAGSSGESRNALQLIKDNAITDELIRSTPDFRTLFYDQRFQPILEQAGYADQLAKLREATGGIDVAAGSKKSGTGGETSTFDTEVARKLNQRNARRLDTLRKQREQASAEKAKVQNATGGVE
jgi:hypothetical protein